MLSVVWGAWSGGGTQVCNFKQLCKTCVASQVANLKTAYITMPIQDTDPENYKRPRWDPSLLEDEDSDDDIVDDDSDDGEDGDDDIVDDSSDDGDSEEDEDFSSSSDDEEARVERNQRLRTETANLRAEWIAVEAIRQEEYALRDQIRQDIRRIDARTQLLREQRDRDLQFLANISENARARALEDRAVGRSENPGVPVLYGGQNLPPLVEIGLTDLPKSGGAQGRQACTHTRTSCSGVPEYNTAQSRPLVVLIQQLQPQLASATTASN